MNPFLEVPVVIEGDFKIKRPKGFLSRFFGEPTITRELKPSVRRIRPGEIEGYEPTTDGGTHVIMKSGGEFDSVWNFNEMDEALTSYNSTINDSRNKGKFGNVVVNLKPDKIALKPEPKLEKV